MSFLGTDLNQAYGPLSGVNDNSVYLSDNEELIKKNQPPPKAIVQSNIPQQLYDSKTISNQYDQEKKLMNILTEIKKQQKITTTTQDSQSYIDKMYSKRKELWKALQISLIIILAMSIHFIIDHYLKLYINNTELSFERELFIRLLYPIAIIFILWNLKTFIK
jgi:hypothetical protein